MNKKERQQKEKLERLEKVNQLIQTIASTGRKFFAYKGKVSRMELDGRGAVWFIDKYEDARIYTHYPGRKWTYDAQEEQWECFFSLDKEGVLPVPGRPINVSMTISKMGDGSCIATAIINERPYQQTFFDVEKAMVACDFMLMAHARDELARAYALYTACLKFPRNPNQLQPKATVAMKFKFAYDGLKSILKEDVIKPYLVFNQSDKG